MDHNNHDLHANDREVGQGIHPDGDIAGIDSPTDIKCRMIVRINPPAAVGLYTDR